MSNFELIGYAVWGLVALFIVLSFARSVRIVNTQTAQIVERLGRYHVTLEQGFHVLIPFADHVAGTLDLREQTLDIEPQQCFSKDEVQVEVDGVIYISVKDPVKATYGVTNFMFAAVQMAQTTTRSIIGTLELDRLFEERDVISRRVVEALNSAGANWGIHVHRYEVKNIKPPQSVQGAMEKQVNSERERRAIVAQSEGDKTSRINTSEGLMREMINLSEGEMQKIINEAEGRAAEIRALGDATAASIETLARSIQQPGGMEALSLELAKQYLGLYSIVGDAKTQIVLSADITQPDQLIDAMKIQGNFEV
jgi:regulator of protease activity HflC (stomatin/prohibitin superfamily)